MHTSHVCTHHVLTYHMCVPITSAHITCTHPSHAYISHIHITGTPIIRVHIIRAHITHVCEHHMHTCHTRAHITCAHVERTLWALLLPAAARDSVTPAEVPPRWWSHYNTGPQAMHRCVWSGMDCTCPLHLSLACTSPECHPDSYSAPHSPSGQAGAHRTSWLQGGPRESGKHGPHFLPRIPGAGDEDARQG